MDPVSETICILSSVLGLFALLYGFLLVGKKLYREPKSKHLPPAVFFEEFYKHHIKGKEYASNIELSDQSNSFKVCIMRGEIRTEVSWLSESELEVYTWAPSHYELPFHIVQSSDQASKHAPTGDAEFDEAFYVHECSEIPSAPIRDVLMQCVCMEGHKKVYLSTDGIASIVDHSLRLPFEDLMRQHLRFFEAYAQNPEVLDPYNEHKITRVRE